MPAKTWNKKFQEFKELVEFCTDQGLEEVEFNGVKIKFSHFRSLGEPREIDLKKMSDDPELNKAYHDMKAVLDAPTIGEEAKNDELDLFWSTN